MNKTCRLCGCRLGDDADWRWHLCAGCLFDPDGDLIELDDEPDLYDEMADRWPVGEGHGHGYDHDLPPIRVRAIA